MERQLAAHARIRSRLQMVSRGFTSVVMAIVPVASLVGCDAPIEGDDAPASLMEELITKETVTVAECPGTADGWIATSFVTVRPGDRLRIHCWGVIWSGYWLGGPISPKGDGPARDSKFPLSTAEDPKAMAFGVIAKLSTQKFFVGDYHDRLVTTPVVSKVRLRVNDDTPCNGTGAFSCEVEVDPFTECKTNADCRSGMFCAFPTICGTGGKCVPIPSGPCPGDSPVCGCDKISYEDACTANQLGISVASKGLCP